MIGRTASPAPGRLSSVATMMWCMVGSLASAWTAWVWAQPGASADEGSTTLAAAAMAASWILGSSVVIEALEMRRSLSGEPYGGAWSRLAGWGHVTGAVLLFLALATGTLDHWAFVAFAPVVAGQMALAAHYWRTHRPEKPVPAVPGAAAGD